MDCENFISRLPIGEPVRAFPYPPLGDAPDTYSARDFLSRKNFFNLSQMKKILY